MRHGIAETQLPLISSVSNAKYPCPPDGVDTVSEFWILRVVEAPHEPELDSKLAARVKRMISRTGGNFLERALVRPVHLLVRTCETVLRMDRIAPFNWKHHKHESIIEDPGADRIPSC